MFKKILKKLASPGRATAIVAVCLFVASAAGMAATFVLYPDCVWGYVLNVATVVFLGYIIFLIVLLCKKLRPRLSRWAQKYPFTKKFAASYDFRTMIYAAFRFLINLGYAAFNGVYGIMFRQPWYIALFIYYTVLCVTRGTMVNRARKVGVGNFTEERRQEERLKIYRAAGILLLVLTAALYAMLMQMLADPEIGFRYAGMLIFVAAGYTVYKMIMAVYNLVKVKGSEDRVVHAVRNLNFADALVSVLALQTAMIAQFSEEGSGWKGNIGFGSIICVVTAALGVYMIVKAQRSLKTVRQLPINGAGAPPAEQDGSEISELF